MRHTNTYNTLRSVFSETEGSLFVNPTPRQLETLANVGVVDETHTRVLASKDTIQETTSDFKTASKLAELKDERALELRTTSFEREGTLVVSDEELSTLTPLGKTLLSCETTEDEAVDKASDLYGDKWTGAYEYDIDTPALKRVEATMRQEFGDEVWDDFAEVLDEVETVEAPLDEITLTLLVAAKHGLEIKSVSEWVDNIGIASKAKTSRVKNNLEDVGVIDTEQVPIDVGRPRQKLKMGEPDSLEIAVKVVSENVTA